MLSKKLPLPYLIIFMNFFFALKTKYNFLLGKKIDISLMVTCKAGESKTLLPFLLPQYFILIISCLQFNKKRVKGNGLLHHNI